MSVLIKGMEKPEYCGYCRFRYDGICHALQKTQYSMNECPLAVIDDAWLNDTISRQAAIDTLENTKEVVRCKDCKHKPSGTGANRDLEFPDEVCPCQCEDYWYSWMPKDDWFCANGERKEE